MSGGTIFTPTPELETVHLGGGGLVCCASYGAIFRKTSVYMSLPSNKSVYYHADKEIFYTIFVNEYFRIAKAYPQSRPSMKNFVPPPTYQTSRNLFDPTVNYRTIGPYLQSKHHQCRSLFLSRRGTQSEKVSHLKLPLKTSSDIQQKHNASLLLRSLDMLRGDKSGKVILCGHRLQPTSDCSFTINIIHISEQS